MDRLWEKNTLIQEEMYFKGKETDFGYMILPNYL